MENEDEISLIDLLAVLLVHKWLIIGVTVAAMAASIALSVASMRLPPEQSFMPNTYTSTAIMLISESSSSSGLSSALASSGLAQLAGISVSGGSSTNSGLAQYLTTTNSFLDAIVDEFNLVERFKIEKNIRAASRKALSGKISAAIDSDSKTFSLSVTDTDPAFAQEVATFALDWLAVRFDELGMDSKKVGAENLEKNIATTYQDMLDLENELANVGASISTGRPMAGGASSLTTRVAKIQLELEAKKAVYTQLRAQYELLRVSLASETPVFQILEYPEVPDMKSGPSRGKLCIIVSAAAFFMSVFMAFTLNAWHNIRNDEKAWAKLHPARARKERKHEEKDGE